MINADQMSRIGLGTVQLGLPYGNHSHLPLIDEAQAFEILRAAAATGIRFFDTASSYGESEFRIGRSKVLADFPRIEISTKVPRVDRDIWSEYGFYKNFVLQVIAKSKQLLGQSQLGLLQFHQCDLDFLGATTVHRVVRELIDTGVISSAGVSVYKIDEAKAALESQVFSALQVPVNILDPTFATGEFLRLAKARNTRLIARSVFLQGLLIADAAIPQVVSASRLMALRNEALVIAEVADRPLVQLALDYVVSNLEDVLDVVLIGIDSIESLKSNAAMVEMCRPLADETLEAFRVLHEKVTRTGVLDPRNWHLQ